MIFRVTVTSLGLNIELFNHPLIERWLNIPMSIEYRAIVQSTENPPTKMDNPTKLCMEKWIHITAPTWTCSGTLSGWCVVGSRLPEPLWRKTRRIVSSPLFWQRVRAIHNPMVHWLMLSWYQWYIMIPKFTIFILFTHLPFQVSISTCSRRIQSKRLKERCHWLARLKALSAQLAVWLFNVTCVFFPAWRLDQVAEWYHDINRLYGL